MTEVSMLGTEKCCESGCERRVLVGRGYCFRHGGPVAYARDQRSAKRAEKERGEAEAKAEKDHEQKRRLHAQGQWGTGAGRQTGKTAQKAVNRVAAEKRAREDADRRARTELARQMLASWRERRLGEIAAELNLNLGKKPQFEMAQTFLTEEEPAKRVEFEAKVAGMTSLPTSPKPIVEKPKKEKKGKDEDGKGKGKKGGKGK